MCKTIPAVTTAFLCGLLAQALVAAPAASATELVYVPVNPSFGGSPLNGAVLLNAAQAQNKHTEPKSSQPGGPGQQTPLQQFNEILERAVLNRLVSAATTSVMGADGKLKEGVVNTGNFTIEITDLGGGMLMVKTTDKVTGAATSFQVGAQ
ncbi:MAG TPA: curli assembly protein CsgF [Noviherbaspirillum sp.]|jgi:curli production assembly/transport component CsgF|uniref:curli assembly protein CsgF n=1 Tax=Noviherbaspirillum sp. TaxID=1926288 RepID=UPI002F93E99F